MEKTLKAWKPYELGLKCCNKLDSVSDMNFFPDWDVYWLSGITSVRAVWHILTEQDLVESDLKLEIKTEYKKEQSSDPIFRDFVRNQRNRTIKSWVWDVVAKDFMLGGKRHQEFIPTHKDLVFDYPNPETPEVDVDENLQGEDPIRLLYISLERTHEFLSKIEISIAKKDFNGFFESDLTKAYHESQLFAQAPRYYR